MKFKVQIICVTDGQEEVREIVCLERGDLKPETLGLTLAEGKALLKDLQEAVVEKQITAYLETQQKCPQCGKTQHSKGHHPTTFRTVFGDLTVKSPRLYHCDCRPRETKTFSPLAELLPDHNTPERLFLATKWASLVSYGITVDLLKEVLPIGEKLNDVTIRNHVHTIAERMEQALGKDIPHNLSKNCGSQVL